jgi:DNA polymerase-3 subunit delta
MAGSPHRTLKQAIEKRSFEGVYYFHGENDFLKEESSKQLIGAVVDPATRDFNLEVRRAGDVDASTIATILSTPPMMAERRMVVLRDVAALKKDARAELDRYLAKPSSDTVLLLIASAGATKADTALEQAATAIDFAQLNDNQLGQWIEHQVSRGGGTITEGATRLLAGAVGNDLPQLAMEIDKLLSFAGAGAIDEDAVASAVGVRKGETLADLLDRVAVRDGVGALELLPQILEQPKINPVFLVMVLTVNMMATDWGKAKRDEGMSVGVISREYYNLLKETGATLTGRPWSEAISSWTRAFNHWTPRQLEAAMEALLKADIALKESKISSEAQIVSSLILTMCGSAAQETAA